MTVSVPSAGVFQGHYRYTDDLLKLSATSTSSPSQDWPTYKSPIKLDELGPFLTCHPDQTFASYILSGLANGFRVGFSRDRAHLKSRGKNHPSSLAHSAVVDARIASELAAGRLLGPVTPQLAPEIHTSPLGLVPKSHQPNQWRLICDLSSPTGSSVNDGIQRDICSLRYATVDDAVQVIQRLGRGTQLVKLDIKDAYRIVPVHPDDYHLLGITWRGSTYIDRALPFGLRSAPKIFTAIADAVAWVLTCEGIENQLHYLDDFLFIGRPSSNQGQEYRAVALQSLAKLGIPVAAHKTQGPSSSLTFLGILLDTTTFELHLPDDKLTRLQEALQQWSRKRSCTKKELESFLGHLSHAATVIPQGRVFLRQLFTLLTLNRQPNSISASTSERGQTSSGGRCSYRGGTAGNFSLRYPLHWRSFQMQQAQLAVEHSPVLNNGSKSCGQTPGSPLQSPQRNFFQSWWPRQFGDPTGAANESVFIPTLGRCKLLSFTTYIGTPTEVVITALASGYHCVSWFAVYVASTPHVAIVLFRY